ncbi:hypothetical protein H5P28_19070 [Ruficoccus amylovorans]|uniref:Uncharacterized protein n=1 Tax=Ruficoccus amylovorans TaxID=1804625 RepID=A0A842HHY2_9BACT|nr:hypothetical protein [Ruficoccus amylovorans]MBC2596375.1 hypothetical protein [Ruficoccus amylovorans]
MLGFIVIFVFGLLLGSPFLLHGLMSWRIGAKDEAVAEWTLIGLIAFVGGILAAV